MMRSILMKLCGVFEAELLVYYQHRKFVSRAYEKTGHFASREGISRDAGHMGRNTGCPGKYGTVGNPSGKLAETNYGHNPPVSKNFAFINHLSVTVFLWRNLTF